VDKFAVQRAIFSMPSLSKGIHYSVLKINWQPAHKVLLKLLDWEKVENEAHVETTPTSETLHLYHHIQISENCCFQALVFYY